MVTHHAPAFFEALRHLCVGVTHDLLEHDVDEGAPLAACAGSVGVLAQMASFDGAQERRAAKRREPAPAPFAQRVFAVEIVGSVVPLRTADFSP